MSDPSNPNATPSNDAAPVNGEAGAPVNGEAGALANGEAGANGDGPRLSKAAKLAAHPKVKQAISLAKEHPLGAVATVAAAAALVEIEFAVGILTGIGATALLATRSGPQARDEVIARGREAIARARDATALLAKRSGPQARDEVIARGREAIARARGVIAKRRKASPAPPAPSAEAPPPAA